MNLSREKAAEIAELLRNGDRAEGINTALAFFDKAATELPEEYTFLSRPERIFLHEIPQAIKEHMAESHTDGSPCKEMRPWREAFDKYKGTVTHAETPDEFLGSMKDWFIKAAEKDVLTLHERDFLLRYFIEEESQRTVVEFVALAELIDTIAKVSGMKRLGEALASVLR